MLLAPVTVKTGISDGTNYAEVLDGLKEGDVIVTGTVSPVTASTFPPPGASPFGGPPFGGGGFRR